MEQDDVMTCLALVSHVLCYANSAINPLIYNFMSGKYRREFRRAFCCSSMLSHDKSTTSTRLTTSKKKFNQSFENGQRCSHMSLKMFNCNHTALVKNHNFGPTPSTGQSYRCERMSFNGQKCNRVVLNGHRCGQQSFKSHSCGHGASQSLTCELNNGQR